MNKNELILRQTQIAASRFSAVLNAIVKVAQIALGVLAIKLIMDGLADISSKNPEGVSALAAVVKNLNVSGIMGWVFGVGSAGAFLVERRGKKRLINKVAQLTREVEADDPYHPSSGLTETGDTPENTED